MNSTGAAPEISAFSSVVPPGFDVEPAKFVLSVSTGIAKVNLDVQYF